MDPTKRTFKNWILHSIQRYVYIFKWTAKILGDPRNILTIYKIF